MAALDTLFILNPAAGHGRAGGRWRDAYERVKGRAGAHRVVETERPGHGRELARAAFEDGARLVVAVGGDGTVGEVVDGLLAASAGARANAAMATFPAGSGCDFAGHARIPRDPAAWADAFASGTVKRLDAGRATFRVGGVERVRHFLNMAAAGLPGDVALAVEKRGKPLGGTLTYLLEGALAATLSRARRMRLTLDGKPEEGDFHLFTAANTSTFGGGMKVAPDADTADGLLDIVTIGAMSNASLLALLPKAHSGGHVGKPGVSIRRARRVELSGPERLPLNIDGDAEGEAPAVFEALPGVLPFRY
ncbi:MAG: diacylglycerol kinase family lipid kinase [Elusimicrobiota bacterium]|nr:diacylglycerol kinase family lipid kinase [Elusimicrobiota bacterium]